VIWREFMRLGYLRHVLMDNPAMPTAVLVARLECAPAVVMADSASRDAHPPVGGTHLRALRRLRGR
jgi:hypothetical protein